MQEIAYVAGEASGDRHAGALHSALIATSAGSVPPAAWGIGGRAMRSAGIDLIVDSSRWGAIGVVESLRGVSEYVAAFAHLKAELLRRRPRALVLVDFGYFNVRLARWARRTGIGPIIYYLPPGSWKRRTGGKSVRELAGLCDLIITPFSWSDANLRAAGANSHWLGHPLLDIVRPTMDPVKFDSEFGVDPSRPVIALLPGSRTAEVENILPTLLRASAIISRRVPGTQFLLAAAPNLDRSLIEKMLQDVQDAEESRASRFRFIIHASGKLKQMATSAIEAAQPGRQMVTSEGIVLNETKRVAGDSAEPWQTVQPEAHAHSATLAIVENLTYDCLSRSDLVITASGTATLEAAILNRPMIIVYRGSKLMELEYHLRKKRLGIEFIGLPNIIAGRKVVPELIQNDASPQAVADQALGFLIEPERLMTVKQVLAESIRPALGDPGAIERAARLIWSVIDDTGRSAVGEGKTDGNGG
jgi:lipid-A-disaccharide synthase